MSEQKKDKTGQDKTGKADAERLSRREALEAGLKKAAYVAPVAALLLSRPAKAGTLGSNPV